MTPEQQKLTDERNALIVEKQRIESECSDMRAELLSYQQQCMRNGFAGKQNYFEHKARVAERRADLVRQRTELDSQISALKGKIQRIADAEYEARCASSVQPKQVVDELRRLCRWASQIIGDDDWQREYAELIRWAPEERRTRGGVL